MQALLFGVVLYRVALAFLSPKSDLLQPSSIPEYGRRVNVLPGMAEALDRTGRFCDVSEPSLFKYSTAITGLPGLLSQKLEDCSPLLR